MTAPLPFYFAWVDADQTTFDPSTMNVMDETIFVMDLKQEEGHAATLDLTIKNPRTGLLAPGRKVWAWLSYQSPVLSGIQPIFFGVLIGIPTNLFAETITLKMIARPSTYIEDKQAVAETLKIFPYYDPIFLTETKRDDPDAILEGWSALYHIDRTSLATTVSDVLEGEDGTIVFEEGDAFYNSVSLTLDQSPLNTVRVQSSVNWTQRTVGFVNGPNVNVQSYTGGSFLSDWPKPGAGLGAGWTVETSFVTDVYAVDQTPMANVSNSWTNNAQSDGDCSTQAISDSSSWPALLSPTPLSHILTLQSQSGVCDPFETPPVNRPAFVKVTGVVVPLWVLNCAWTLRYNARRQYTEDIFVDVNANTQAILTSPTVQQDTELLKVNGSDVGQPLITYDAWTDFAGQHVDVGQMIFPNDPTTVGGLSYQVAIASGTAGSDEPSFSDIPGQLTDDGGVVWASLGETPESVIQQMQFATSYGPGTILLYQARQFDINIGELVDIPGETSYWVVTAPTTTNTQYTEMTYVPPITDSDEPTPAPRTVFLEVFTPTAQMTELGPQPAFLGIPIGGTAENVTAYNYFPTDRGQLSVQHLICRARARLRIRARAVKIGFECPFDAALGVTLRHNATLYDPRLPGGVATGKVISYGLSASGGKMIGKVEIGCAVGFGGSVAGATGTPEYTAGTGYMLPGYQKYDGAAPALPSSDISYTPPVYTQYDDGLRFPLTSLPSDGGAISGNLAAQQAAIEAAFPIQETLSNLTNQFQFNTTPDAEDQGSSSGFGPTAAWWIEQQQIYYAKYALPYVMEAHPISYEILIHPVTNGPFNGAYQVSCSPLEIPQGINLEAPSSP